MSERTPLDPRWLHAGVLLAVALTTTTAMAAQLRVTIDDIRSTEGQVLVQVFAAGASAEAAVDGDGDATVASMALDPVPPSVDFTVELEPGTYGMRVMQDLDGDGEMSTNLVGIPTEPWAFSNNATGRFGPPAPEDLHFRVSAEPGTQVLRLIH